MAYTINYYPHEHQTRFHESNARIRLILSGIRGGKTVAGMNEAIRVSLNGKPPFVPQRNVGAIVAATYPMLRDVVLPEFFKFCPEDLLVQFSAAEFKAVLANGSIILFRSADNPERLRGLDLNWFWMDEAAIAKKSAYDILLGRISQKGGIAWLTTTPKGYNWLYKEVYKKFEEKLKEYDVVIFRSTDNPYFPKEEIERMKQIYTEDFFQQELEAKFILATGLVYKTYNPLIHLKDIPEKHYPRTIAGVDWGYTNPSCIEVIGIDADDHFNVIQEWYHKNKLIEETTHAAQQLAQTYHITTFYCDPSEPQFITQFQRAGLSAIGANNDVRYGINAVGEQFHRDHLLIDKKCKHLSEELLNYRYPEEKEEKPVQELPVKVDDHACDALRYALATFKKSVGFGLIAR